ncbi:MAG: hypothetical protein ACKV2T_18190 [Kofleriaceae bacterium]
MSIAAALVVVSASSPDADAKCARQFLSPMVLPDAPNGAIVMLRSSSQQGSREDIVKWTLRVDGKDVAPVIDVLAPGLSVYRLPKSVAAAELTDGTSTLAKLTASATAKPLPAPKVTAVRHASSRGPRGGSSRTTVSITGDAPADAIAIVITDAKGKPLSYGHLTSGAGLDPYYRGRCGLVPNGTVEPMVGQSVRIFWVDKYGQASATSAPIKVTKKPE